jgi:iron complex transport system substrate-binding protein
MHAPRRIASLISSGTEILFGLGLGERVVAVSHECDFPAEAHARPKATHSLVDSSRASRAIDDQVRELAHGGAALYGIDEPLLVGLAPELIVTQAQCDVCAVRYDDVLSLVRRHPELSATRVLALNPRSLAEVLSDVLRVGEAAGASEAARDYAAALSRRIEAVRAAAHTLPPAARPRVVCIEWLDPLMLAANWTPELVEIVGGQSGLAKAGGHSVYNDWQAVLDYDPEVLLVLPCGFDLSRTLAESAVLPSWQGWSSLSAVQRGRVYALDGNAYFNRSGPRLVESLEILAHLLHPELFPPPLAPAERAAAWKQFVSGFDPTQLV